MKTGSFGRIKSFLKADTGGNNVKSNQDLKLWIWLYFFLWIFEGALRKWFIPALSTPLLLIRDPVVLLLMFLAIRRRILKINIYYSGMLALGVLSIVIAVFWGHGNILVAIYGARTMLLYFPLIFIIGRLFDKEDVIKMGRVFLWISIPMTLLIVLQFYSPQTSFVNRGVGGDEAGAGFGGAMGFYRPPGTFSFTNGTTCFYSCVAPFVIYFWLNSHHINRKILLAATAGLMIAIPISISRALFLQVALSIFFLLVVISRQPKYFGRIIGATALVAVSLVLFSNVKFFSTATKAFTSRFDDANQTEGGLVKGTIGNRFLGSLVSGVTSSTDSIFGYGVGSGTQVGANLLEYDEIVLKADFEWIRQILELGILGLFLIALRVGLAIKIGMVSFRKSKKNQLLPWLLMSVGFFTLVQGIWSQPTSLGYSSLIVGLWLASLNNRDANKAEEKKKVVYLNASLAI